MGKKEEILTWLTKCGVSFETVVHPAVFTIDALEALQLDKYGLVCKNLFLRDQKGKRHYLVVVRQEKQVDLKALGQRLGDKLSFASEERLERYLHLTKGAVTPLGVFYNEARNVEVIIDQDLMQESSVGVHPGENDASVFLSPDDLVRLIQTHGNPVSLLQI